MKTKTRNINLTIYVIGMLSIILGAFVLRDYMLVLISFGSAFLLIPLIACIYNNIKSDNKDKFAWTIFLLFMGGISIPAYLLNKK